MLQGINVLLDELVQMRKEAIIKDIEIKEHEAAIKHAIEGYLQHPVYFCPEDYFDQDGVYFCPEDYFDQDGVYFCPEDYFDPLPTVALPKPKVEANEDHWDNRTMGESSAVDM